MAKMYFRSGAGGASSGSWSAKRGSAPRQGEPEFQSMIAMTTEVFGHFGFSVWYDHGNRKGAGRISG